MKKLLASVMAVAMLASMSTGAFADNLDNVPYFSDEDVIVLESAPESRISVSATKKFRGRTWTTVARENLENAILLSDNSDNKQICLVDEHDSEYISYLNEIPQFNLVINKGEQKQFTIRFAKGYSSSTNSRYIKFKNIWTTIHM